MDFGNHMDVAYVQKALAARFGVQLVIDRVVARNIAAGLAAKASVFFATDGQLYCLVYGPSRLLLGDIKKIAVRIGLRAETFFPPEVSRDLPRIWAHHRSRHYVLSHACAIQPSPHSR